jgi:hypothetical protein
MWAGAQSSLVVSTSALRHTDTGRVQREPLFRYRQFAPWLVLLVGTVYGL